MVRKPGWLIGFALLLAACSTKSPEPEFELTPATQTGANTVSFRVDGRVWQPYGRRCFGYGGGPCIDKPLTVYYNTKRGQFQIAGFLTTNTRAEDFGLNCDSLFQAGVCVIPPPGPSYRARSGGMSYAKARVVTDPSYGSRNPTQVSIEITRLDTVSRIVSGLFTGRLPDQLNPAQVAVITDGRFDVKY